MKKKIRTSDLSYREQIEIDLGRLAVKWTGKGMPGLAAILILVNQFYSMELEGYLLGMLAPLHRFMSRVMGAPDGTTVTESNTERTTRTPTTRSRHLRRHAVLADAKKSQRRADAMRVPRRRR